MDEIKMLLKGFESNKENLLEEIEKSFKKKESVIKNEQIKNEMSYEECKEKFKELLKTYKLFCKIIKINK
ncbi:hypothetical protein TUBRATIS_13590 [Tubulinosema ratisbonensis]|uniref:Uncharacterized protein n=1 Tax=Tubulinosema ratisbonensis TaxID=291195 RepID=A0A437ALU4_9MICR|nr:hypothetical protein TUBRATIS_13590 [Tubulinosema ratisbonensis]